jgi:hypothetical protein
MSGAIHHLEFSRNHGHEFTAGEADKVSLLAAQLGVPILLR